MPSPRSKTKPPTISALKKSMKGLHIKELQKQVDNLTGTLEAIKRDPEGVIAPFLQQMSHVVEQNNRLTALVGAIIEDTGTITIKDDRLEAFQGYKVEIKFTLNKDEGTVTFDVAKTEIPKPKIQPEQLEVKLTEPQPEFATA